MRPLVPCLLAVLALLLGSAPIDAKETLVLRDGELVRDYAGTLPHVEDERVCLLVRDARSHAPIPHAQLSRHLELVMGKHGWGPEVGRWETDALGLMSTVLPGARDEGDCHWMARATGRGVGAEYAVLPNGPLDLEPSRRLHGRILDDHGKPVVGAVIHHKLGCAHSPPADVARTDASGYFTIEHVGNAGDFILMEGPGVMHEYGVRTSEMHLAPALTFAEPGYTLHGRLVFHRHGIRDDTRVLASQSSRGPHAAVGEDGRFVLPGLADRGPTLYVHNLDLDEDFEAVQPIAGLDVTDYRPGAPILWYGEREDDGMDEAETVALALDVRSPDGKRLHGITVNLDRVRDNHRTSLHDPELDEDEVPEPFAEAIPAGAYRVSLGETFDPHTMDEQLVTYPFGTRKATLRIQARTKPTLEIQLDEGTFDDEDFASLRIGVESIEFPLAPEGGTRDPIHLPADAPAYVVYRGPQGQCACPVGPVKDGTRRVEIKPVPWPVLTLPDTDTWDDPEPFAANAEFHELSAKGGLRRYAVEGAGRVLLRLNHAEHGGGRVVVDVPAEPGVVRPIPVDQLVFDDAGPSHAVQIEVFDPSQSTYVAVSAYRPSPLADGGWFEFEPRGKRTGPGTHDVESPDLVPGTQVRVEVVPDSGRRGRTPGVAWLPVFTTLEGASPYRIRVPRGSLTLTIVPEDVSRAGAGAYVSGALVEVRNPNYDPADGPRRTAVFHGVPDGRHKVVVAVPGHQSRYLELEIRNGEQRTLEIPLRRVRNGE